MLKLFRKNSVYHVEIYSDGKRMVVKENKEEEDLQTTRWSKSFMTKLKIKN